MNTPIRLSPSGPTLKNADGGILGFGSGARLRKVKDVQAYTSPAPLDATPVVLPNAVALSTPDAGYKYDARVEFDVQNASAGPGVLNVALQSSVDAGASWTTRATAQVPVGGNSDGTLDCQHVALEFPSFLTGAALGVTTGATPLQVRATVAAPSGANITIVSVGTNGTLALSLEELF